MLYLTPIIGALIGWIIFSIAAKALVKNYFLKRQQQLAASAGALVSKQLFSFDQIKTKLTDPEKIKNIIPLVEVHLDGFLRERLPKAMPVLSMFIGDSIVNQIKTHLVAEMDLLFPQLINQYLDDIQQDLDLERIVADKINSISATEMEALTTGLLRKPLSQLQLLGALTGFLTGLIALVITYFC
ncbi:MAG TPA: hypothetical protein VM802_23075 [Chitinophaga sp.]|uniref:DUF445 domain-containing protein n=1 Tax=Chitinophaga sp. TaxID=1869181 RepID=UPI002C07DDDC|nr:hypothetical protein [Chitinophaga sp.]HVI47773.1 hypothetical protein [Chitinophaga sp.]